MAKVAEILLLFALAVVGQALTPSTYLTSLDLARLQSVFEILYPYPDAVSAHYSIAGLKRLGLPVKNSQTVCRNIVPTLDKRSISSLYHVSTASKLLGKCQVEASESKSLLERNIKGDSLVVDIFHAFFALKNLGFAVDNAKVATALAEALKNDDSPLSHGYAFYIAAELTGDVSKFFDSIEDVMAQADEVDEKYLQFEGGLFVTALVIDAAYRLAERVKKAPTISEDKVIKFSNYFLSRKHVHQLKSSYYLLSVIQSLTTNQFHIPVAVTRASPVAVSQSSSRVQVRVTNLMGGSLGQLTVTADYARHSGDEAVVLSKKPFSSTSSDKSLYELNFMQTNPARGFYKIGISVIPQKPDKRLIGTSGAEVQVKVTTRVVIENVEIGIADKDQTTAARTTKLQHPNKAANLLEADYHQKILMKFQLKDKSSGKLMTAHQSFIRLTNIKTKQEIIFVTEADGSLTNKFDLDVGAGAKDFSYLSGKYSLELIIGDAVIENPFSWHLIDNCIMTARGRPSARNTIVQNITPLHDMTAHSLLRDIHRITEKIRTQDGSARAIEEQIVMQIWDSSSALSIPMTQGFIPIRLKADIVLAFPEGAPVKKEQINQFAKKPEITHIFRTPEKRPPPLVSTAFTALILLPLLVLFGLWLKIGVNVYNFSMSVSALGFHICLGCIFGLYFLYWQSLNMFQTLRYLGVLSVMTFMFGNRLLSGIAAQRKK